MKATLLITHGSRRAESNDAMRQLAEALQQHSQQHVQVCYLELAEPLVCAGFDQLVAEGATEITLLPYFLAPGKHVTRDVPHLLAQCQARHPRVQATLLEHAGAHPAFFEALISMLPKTKS